MCMCMYMCMCSVFVCVVCVYLCVSCGGGSVVAVGRHGVQCWREATPKCRRPFRPHDLEKRILEGISGIRARLAWQQGNY